MDFVMKVRYTAHSEEQIKERKLEKVWIEETITFKAIGFVRRNGMDSMVFTMFTKNTSSTFSTKLF